MHGRTYKCITTCSALRRPLRYSQGSNLFTNFRFNKMNMRELLANKLISLLLILLFFAFLLIYLHQWAVKNQTDWKAAWPCLLIWQGAKHDSCRFFRRRCSVQSVLSCTLLVSQPGFRELKLYQRMQMCLSLECHVFSQHLANPHFQRAVLVTLLTDAAPSISLLERGDWHFLCAFNNRTVPLPLMVSVLSLSSNITKVWFTARWATDAYKLTGEEMCIKEKQQLKSLAHMLNNNHGKSTMFSEKTRFYIIVLWPL